MNVCSEERQSLSDVTYRREETRAGSTAGLKPKPELTSNPEGAALTGNTVTLTCHMDQSTGWQFYWYQHTQKHQKSTTDTNSYTVNIDSVSDGGQYWCRAGRGNPVYYTHFSDALWVNVTDQPKTILTVKPEDNLFRGETVTLRCDIQGGGDTEWTYSWTLENKNTVGQYKKQEYKISCVEHTHSGKYTCRGTTRDGQNSEISDAVTLTVSDKAQAVLRVSPQKWLTEGDSVTLICEVNGSSTGWTFSWYRDDNDCKYKVLSDSSRGAGGNYTLSSAAVNHTGVYKCRGERGEPAYYTEYSNTQTLCVTGVSPSVSLIISPSRTQHFTSESLSLSCEDQSNSTGWTVRRYTDSGYLQDCSSSIYWGSQTGSTCRISYTYTSDTGVYWCHSESGEISNPVNITVHNGRVILESPVHPVTEGDSLTLRCLYRYKNPSVLTADFYKDGSLLQNQTTGEMIIPTVSKSHEGFYSCKHTERGESPKSWISIRASPVSRSVSPGLITGVTVGLSVMLLIILLLVLLWCYKNKKGGVSQSPYSVHHQQNISQTSEQNQNETGYTPLQCGGGSQSPSSVNQQQNISQTSEQNQNETGYTPLQCDSITGPTDITYAEIELKSKKELKKKKGNKGNTSDATPSADTVYSKLNMGMDQKDQVTEPLINKTTGQSKSVNRGVLQDISNFDVASLVSQPGFATPKRKGSLSLGSRRRNNPVSHIGFYEAPDYISHPQMDALGETVLVKNKL
ncbi:Fc receptor-like protein 5 [Xyrauchen texanus]|uniref:Fc receptor-like protein 5 n=1 Tax=Xyrauchen texanus TaxID=154827 RepID=UPI00224271C0|nr:Fc receptor-like protein 5 [Xyrauchen texanus]